MLDVSAALEIVKNNKKVAIIGLSPKEDRPSYQVGNFLQNHDYQIIPINPGPYDEILGQKNIKILSNLQPGQADWIDIFLNPTRLMDISDEIIRLAPKLVWCQIGVVNEEFNQKLIAASIPVIANKCPKIEW